MPTQIRNIEPKFFSQLKNGETYVLNPNDFISYLGGNTSEKLKAVFTIQIGTEFELKNWRFLELASDNRYVILQEGADFTEDFFVGSTVVLTDKAGDTSTYTVESVKETELYLEYVSGAVINPSDATSPNRNTDGSFTLLSNISDITGLEYKYGIIENSESFSVVSPLTNTEQAYKVSDIDTTVTGTVHTGVALGKNQAWVTGDITCEFKGFVTNLNVYAQSDTWKEYEITHEFINNTYWESGEDEEIEGNGIPERFSGTESVKYVFETTFLNDPNNPNTARTNQFELSDGSVGYWGENFNGGATKYSISDLVITDNTEGGTVDQLSITSNSTVTFNINDSSNSMFFPQNVVVGHSYRPEADVYGYSESSYTDLWVYDSVWQAGGSAAVAGTIISNYTVTYVSTSQVSVSYDIEFTASQKERLLEGYKYTLWALTEDWSGATTETGGKTSLIVQNNTYAKNGDIPDLYGVDRQEYIPHPQDWVDSSSTTGYANAFMNVEEGMLTFLRFWIDTTKSATLRSLTFILGTVDNDTNEVGELRKVEFDLTDQITAGGIQYITQDETRGFILPEGDQFNWLKINTVDKIGDLQYYEAFIGWKAPWQEWLEYNGADPDAFFDPNEALNGLSQFSQRYSTSTAATSNNFTVNAIFDAVLFAEGVNTTYRNTGGDVEIYGYDEDETGLATYTCTINTYGDPANGSPLYENNMIQDGYTEIRGVLTPLVPPSFSTSLDFSVVDSTWTRWAHGSYLPAFAASPNVYRYDVNDTSTGWLNDQANNDDDVFTGEGMELYKNFPTLYTSTTDTILTTINAFAYYGVYSTDKYEFYSIDGQMYSNDTDDDALAYVIAMNIDDFGVEHTLSFVVTTGGVGLGPNPYYSPTGTDLNTRNSLYILGAAGGDPLADVNWAILYNYGKPDCINLVQGTNTGEFGLNWTNIGDVDFDVSRSGSDIEVSVSLTAGGTPYNETLNYTLGTDPETEKFIGEQFIGFGFLSQASGGFKDVTLTIPDADFYGIVRLDPENSSADGSITESSTERGVQSGSLLNSAALNWDGTSFIISATVNTELIEEGQNYKQSVQIRSKNLTV